MNTRDRVVGSVRVESVWDLTEQDISDLLVTAFEGGINYWCVGIDVPRFPDGANAASDVPGLGGVIYLVDGGDGERYPLDLHGLLQGVRLYCNLNEVNPATLFGMHGDYDANDADQIVQLALFGSVVYG